MDKETFLTKIKEIGSCEDTTDRISMLTALSDEVGKIYENIDDLNNQINTLNESSTKDKEQIDKLQKANMDLFLRVGTTKSEKDINKDSTGVDSEPEKLKFEDLFKKEGDDK